MDKWVVAVGNLEDARVVLDTLAQAIEDAVYLDEDAYNQLLPTMQYTRVVQVWLHWHRSTHHACAQAQQRRLAELEAENARLRDELHEAQGSRAQMEASVAELRQELENNAGVLRSVLYSRAPCTRNSGLQDALQRAADQGGRNHAPQSCCRGTVIWRVMSFCTTVSCFTFVDIICDIR